MNIVNEADSLKTRSKQIISYGNPRQVNLKREAIHSQNPFSVPLHINWPTTPLNDQTKSKFEYFF